MRITSPPMFDGRKLFAKAAARYELTSVPAGTVVLRPEQHLRQRHVLTRIITRYAQARPVPRSTRRA
jgi:hypothetical protein